MSAPPAGTDRVVVDLPNVVGTTDPYVLGAPGPWTRPAGPLTARRAFAAAHVVPLTTADNTPGRPAELDWDATLGFRHMLWSYGLGVAEVMDTAQRGMGLDWDAAAYLIRRTAAEARSVGGLLACGAGTDHLTPGRVAELVAGDREAGLHAVTDAYREQLGTVAAAGATPVLMASRALAVVARDADDYLAVYSTLLSEVTEPVILHWLGEVFDPALAGYWGSADPHTAAATVLELLRAHGGKVDGIKVSLLDAGFEVWLREQLPAGVRLYSGDDLNYPELVVGDDRGHSDALLGVFAAIAPAASTALQALESRDEAGRARALEILRSTEALGRHMFEEPTPHYKVGIAFLSWLNGHQPGFQMVGGLQSARSARHLTTLFRLADGAGLLLDPDRAAHRMRAFLEVAGITPEETR